MSLAVSDEQSLIHRAKEPSAMDTTEHQLARGRLAELRDRVDLPEPHPHAAPATKPATNPHG